MTAITRLEIWHKGTHGFGIDGRGLSGNGELADSEIHYQGFVAHSIALDNDKAFGTYIEYHQCWSRLFDAQMSYCERIGI